jgi:hypothetical protein
MMAATIESIITTKAKWLSVRKWVGMYQREVIIRQPFEGEDTIVYDGHASCGLEHHIASAGEEIVCETQED